MRSTAIARWPRAREMFRKLAISLLFFISIGAAPTTEPRGGRVVAPEKRDLPGQRFAIGEGEVFVPDYFSPGEKTDVIVWFLGAPWVVEQEFYDAHKNAVLFVASSQTLQNNFPGPRHFENLLGNIQLALKKKDICDKPIGNVCLGSFSGGYTA